MLEQSWSIAAEMVLEDDPGYLSERVRGRVSIENERLSVVFDARVVDGIEGVPLDEAGEFVTEDGHVKVVVFDRRTDANRAARVELSDDGCNSAEFVLTRQGQVVDLDHIKVTPVVLACV
jgi:hypothetical protein